jgi:cbb3-type cytochrome oxidase maturation protein
VEVLYLLIPLALLLVAIIVGTFWWATHSDQFDDLEGPAYRILMDDAPPKPVRRDESEESGKKQSSGAKPTDA